MQTLGEKRVVVSFSPSELPEVASFKERCADLIDDINDLPAGNSQCGRWKAEAMTLIETGCMFAVKAATAGQQPEEGEETQ